MEITREEAIEEIECVIHTEVKWPGTEKKVEALEMAISAIRAQAEAEKNEPLTLEELRESVKYMLRRGAKFYRHKPENGRH